MEEEQRNIVNTKLFKNIFIAILITLYFIFINLGSININYNIFLTDLKVFSLVILGISIILFENAYNKDSNELALFGVEILVLACHTLTIIHVITVFKFNFINYILTSSYFFAIYYVLKDIIIYTIEKRKYLESLSDISDIVKKEKPSKKEAKKKSKEKTKEVNIEDIPIKEEKIKEDKANKKPTKSKSDVKKKTSSNSAKKKQSKESEKVKSNNKTKTSKTKKEENKEKLEENIKLENKPKKRGRPKKKVEN